jgi:hypothetical protein
MVRNIFLYRLTVFENIMTFISFYSPGPDLIWLKSVQVYLQQVFQNVEFKVLAAVVNEDFCLLGYKCM